MSLFYSSVPVSHDSVTVSQHTQYQDPHTGVAKWNLAIIPLINYACAFPTVTCRNVFSEKGLSALVTCSLYGRKQNLALLDLFTPGISFSLGCFLSSLLT